jgi:hypothetical protein
MVTSTTKAGTQKLPKIIVKTYSILTLWPFIGMDVKSSFWWSTVFQFNHFQGKCIKPFTNFRPATFATDSRMWRASGANVMQMLRAKFAYDMRHVARVSCKCRAHLPREERATRDVTFGSLLSHRFPIQLCIKPFNNIRPAYSQTRDWLIMVRAAPDWGGIRER